MSSDEDLYGTDSRRRRSMTSPVPHTAEGGGAESPKLSSSDYPDKRGSVNDTTSTTANDIANSDERVRQVLYSDVRSSYFKNAANSV